MWFPILLLALQVVHAAILNPSPIKIEHSPITLHFAVGFNATSSERIVDKDRRRARRFIEAANEKYRNVAAGAWNSTRRIGVSVTDASVQYTAQVGIGSPATDYTLIVDTGSSNTWVGANKPFYATASTQSTYERVRVSYGSGFFVGTEVSDVVTLGNASFRQSIGVASYSNGFYPNDGILGVGPVDLTQGTLSPNQYATIPTVTDSLYSQGYTSSLELGISFQPTNSSSVTNGQLTFGGADSSRYTGQIHFVPITNSSPANEYFGIDQHISYGHSTSILNGGSGILDTGTTLLLLASNAFQQYQQATGGVLDQRTGLLCVTPRQFSAMKSLFFSIGNTVYELTANAQAWPRNLNALIGGSPNNIYLVVSDIGSDVGLDFINGYVFLERFYSVFEPEQGRVGLATTQHTYANIN